MSGDLTFSQMEGIVPLPGQLKLREISQELRAKAWAAVYLYMDEGVDKTDYYHFFKKDWKAILLSWHVNHRYKFIDTFPNDVGEAISQIKSIFVQGAYNEIFDFLQFLVRHPNCPPPLAKSLDYALERSRSAYRIIDKTIVPIVTDEEAIAIGRAFKALEPSKFAGARAHLTTASELLTKGNFAATVRESIHAVESAARILAPNASTLGPALAILEKQGKLHGGMKQAFGALYGYTSDEKGIRHALLDRAEASVSEADALYMFGACASFLTYLALQTS